MNKWVENRTFNWNRKTKELQLEGVGLRHCGGSRERRQKRIGVMICAQEWSRHWRCEFESHQGFCCCCFQWFFNLLILIFGCTLRYVGSWFPEQEWPGIKPAPSRLEGGVLTTGLLEKFSDGSSLITNNEKNQHHSPPEVMLWEGSKSPDVDILPKMNDPVLIRREADCNHEETIRDKMEPTSTKQMACPLEKCQWHWRKGPRNWSRLKESREVWQLNKHEAWSCTRSWIRKKGHYWTVG